MKIVEVRASAHSCRYPDEQLRLGLGRTTKRDFVFIKVVADDGTVGYRESHHGQNPTAMAEIIEHGIGALLIGLDPLDSEGIWHRIHRQQVVTLGLGAASVMALSGIDIALWDLKGKVMGQPIYRLLGGSRRRIRAAAGGLNLGFMPLDALEREAAEFVAQGFTAIKLRVGEHARRDGERVRHIRRSFSEELDIAVDADMRYSGLDVPEVVRYCEDNRVYWLEEPFATDNLPAYRDLRRRTATPLAAGENHYTRHAFRAMFAAGILTVVQADCAKSGGISEVRKIADMAAALNLWMAPHSSHSIISIAATLHLLSAVPNGLIYEADLALPNPFRMALAKNPPTIERGYILPPDRPGLGLDIDESVLAHYPAIPGACYIPDGLGGGSR